MKLAILAGLLCLASSLSADTLTRTVGPGVAELRITAPVGADISWESRDPITLRYLTHELASGESAVVWCAVSGKTYVLVSDVIDWDAKNRTKTTWLVTVAGDDGGDEDDPGDDVKPSPPPSPPDSVPDKYGVGPAVYAAVARLRSKSDAKQVAVLFVAAERELNESRNTSRVVLGQLESAIRSRHPDWIDVAAAFSKSADAAAKQYGAGIVMAKNYVREARLTIELFN